MAGSMSDVYEKRVLDLIFRNALASATIPLGLDSASVWVGLGTVASDSGFTELTVANGYARVAVNRTGTGWNAATGLSPALSDNAVVVTFGTASATWNSGSNITHFGIFDLSAAGNNIYWADLATPKPVLSGDTASFAIGVLDVTQD